MKAQRASDVATNMRWLAVMLVAASACASPGATRTPQPPLEALECEAEPDAVKLGSIAGQVVDPKTAEPVEGAVVVLTSTALRSNGELATDADGRYSFAELPPGSYTIYVLTGMNEAERVVALHCGASVQADIEISPESRFFHCGGPVVPRIALDESLFSVVDDDEARLRHMPETRYGR